MSTSSFIPSPVNYRGLDGYLSLLAQNPNQATHRHKPHYKSPGLASDTTRYFTDSSRRPTAFSEALSLNITAVRSGSRIPIHSSLSPVPKRTLARPRHSKPAKTSDGAVYSHLFDSTSVSCFPYPRPVRYIFRHWERVNWIPCAYGGHQSCVCGWPVEPGRVFVLICSP